jgi:WD40 repeat protein
MSTTRRSKLGLFFLAVIWAAGLAGVWWLTPVGPRDGWQPPRGEFVCGVLRDGQTMVTAPYVPNANGQFGQYSGPVHIWDLETGELRASHFTRDDLLNYAGILRGTDLLFVPHNDTDGHHLRLFNALTGAKVVDLTCRSRQARWTWSDDVRTAACPTNDGEPRGVVVYEIPSGRRICVLPDCGYWICLSPDGRRLAATRDASTIVVFDVASRKEIAKLTTNPRIGPSASPRQFSSDGRFLLDDWPTVWDVDAGKALFQIKQINDSSTLLMPDDRTVVSIGASESQSWLAFSDVETGVEQSDRRVPFMSFASAQHPPVIRLHQPIPDRPWIVADALQEGISPVANWPWLSKIPALQRYYRKRPADAYVIVDTATGREIARGDAPFWSLTPDGRYVISCSRNPDWVFAIWDVPPRQPFWWLVEGLLGWTVALAFVRWLFARVRKRRNKRAGTDFIAPVLGGLLNPAPPA